MASLTPAARLGAIASAASTLQEGGLVLAACESAYLLCASGSSAAGIQGLKALSHPPNVHLPWPPHWLAPDVAQVSRALPQLRGTPLRLVNRLAPGPAVFELPLDENALESFRAALGITPGVVDDETQDGGRCRFRVPAPSPAQLFAQRADVPVAAREIVDESGRLIFDADQAVQTVRDRHGLELGAVLFDGPIPYRQGATVLELPTPGSPLRILRAGAYEERFIRKGTVLTILFICTGNTCRSPMAQAIALDLLAGGDQPADVRILSAGMSAGAGHPASPEIADALRQLGVALPTPPHSSRPVTRELIDQAQVIYGMTSSHVAAVLELAPSAAGKVFTLDPAGDDVPDPVGMGQAVYSDTARRLRELIARRLKELHL